MYVYCLSVLHYIMMGQGEELVLSHLKNLKYLTLKYCYDFNVHNMRLQSHRKLITATNKETRYNNEL